MYVGVLLPEIQEPSLLFRGSLVEQIFFDEHRSRSFSFFFFILYVYLFFYLYQLNDIKRRFSQKLKYKL